MLFSRASILRRPGILRPRFAIPFSVTAAAAHGDNDRRPSSRDIGALMALSGSGQGLWFLPSLSSPLESSSFVFADAAASEQSDSGQSKRNLDTSSEIVNLEFAHYDYKSRGTILAKDFALSMVASADISHINKLLDRVDELDTHPHLKDARITLEEFKSFAELRKTLQPLALAIFDYGRVNGLLTKQDFQQAASHGGQNVGWSKKTSEATS